MAFEFGFTRIPLSAARQFPFFRRSEYPPRVVYELNLGVAILTAIDHSKIKSPLPPSGYRAVDGNADGEVVRPGDLVLDGHSGVWRHAREPDLGVKVRTRLGVARKTAD